MKLAECCDGDRLFVKSINKISIKKRFYEFGFVPGVEWRVFKKYRNMILLNRWGTLVAIDNISAMEIEVEKV